VPLRAIPGRGREVYPGGDLSRGERETAGGRAGQLRSGGVLSIASRLHAFGGNKCFLVGGLQRSRFESESRPGGARSPLRIYPQLGEKVGRHRLPKQRTIRHRRGPPPRDVVTICIFPLERN